MNNTWSKIKSFKKNLHAYLSIYLYLFALYYKSNIDLSIYLNLIMLFYLSINQAISFSWYLSISSIYLYSFPCLNLKPLSIYPNFTNLKNLQAIMQCNCYNMLGSKVSLFQHYNSRIAGLSRLQLYCHTLVIHNYRTDKKCTYMYYNVL